MIRPRLGLSRPARLALLLALATGCHQVAPERRLILSMDPPQLKPGILLTVTAVPDPPAELNWVSGTVKVMGAAQVPFRKDEQDGYWKFKTMIPVFVNIPAGNYQAKAWGQSTDGKRYEGELAVAVK